MVRSKRADVQPMHHSVHRELVDLLYTALPQVAAITVTSVAGAMALAISSGDHGYAIITGLIAVTAALRLYGLRLYPRDRALSTDEVLKWERAYGVGASAFGLALGLLSFHALTTGDGPGAWISFGLSMSFCVGMVSRAAVRPWIVLVTAGTLLAPTMIGGLMRPEFAYKLGAIMLLLFWVTLREASRHLSRAFIERLEAKRALAYQASHDDLTGLPNRAAFLTALEEAAAPNRAVFAVIAIDLDGFKPVNDRLGHLVGDALLRHVAQRLRDCVGTDGFAARMGGDEFMLLLRFECPEPDAAAAMRLARHAIACLGQPFDLGGHKTVSIAASAGVVLGSAIAPVEIDRLLEQADGALYEAKRAGGGCCQQAGAAASESDGLAA